MSKHSDKFEGLRSGPLSKFRVLDMTRVRAGPTAVRHFSDWGADVIRIEPPAGLPDDPLSFMRENPDFQNLHRNKRCITLNIAKPEGLKILYRLVETADVFFENARPAVKHKLKIDYDILSAVNPRLVYGSISGFGQSGEYENRPGYDQVAQGMGGLMSVTGEPGGQPLRVGIPIADLTSGMFLAMGTMTALLEREHSGRGQYVSTSLLQAQIAMMDFQAAKYLMTEQVPGQAGNDHPYLTPMGVFETADGHINIAVATDEQWRKLCDSLAAPELIDDVRFSDIVKRTENREACKAAVSALTPQWTSAELIERLNQNSIPSGPIYNMQQVFEDPQVRHLKMAQPLIHETLGGIELVSQPIDMQRTPLQPFVQTPERGTHTDEVLLQLDYSQQQIDEFRERQII